MAANKDRQHSCNKHGESYSVTPAAMKAVKKNSSFATPHISELTIYQFFEVLGQYINELKDEECNYDELCNNIRELLECNRHLPFVDRLKSLTLHQRRNYECAWTKDKFGELQPIYYIAGSALSGRNKCAYIDPKGDSCSISVYPFSPVWRSFMEVNSHYTEAKQLYEAYSLKEVISILFGDCQV